MVSRRTRALSLRCSSLAREGLARVLDLDEFARELFGDGVEEVGAEVFLVGAREEFEFVVEELVAEDLFVRGAFLLAVVPDLGVGLRVVGVLVEFLVDEGLEVRAEVRFGLVDGCAALRTPVTGGNVSFYNQTGDVAIHPSPVVGVLGVIDDVARRIPSGWQDQGHNIYLLGETRNELDGSVWAGVVHDHLGGVPPVVDLAKEKALAEALNAASEQGLLASAHDLSEGGLAQAVLESCLRFGVGARIFLDELKADYNIDDTAALFSESTARVLVSVGREDDVKFVGLCEARGIPVHRIGVTDGTNLEIQGIANWELEALANAHANTLPELFA